MSEFQSTGLSITAYEPLVIGTQVIDDAIVDQIDSYSHEIRADGGFWSARLTMRLQQDDIEDWLVDGLGRRIVVYDPGLDVVWEGFVNRIVANIGSLSVTRGPLLDVVNRSTVNYSIAIPSVAANVTGSRRVTAVSEDTNSQAKYGIIEQSYSAGDDFDADRAEDLRDTLIQDSKEPQTGQRISVGSRSQTSVTLDCLGYYHWLKAYVYNSGVVIAATDSVSDKIITILDADTNAFISSVRSLIETNSLSVASFSGQDQTALDQIKTLTALGDGTNRFTFGIYEKRVPVYAQIPTTQDYQHELRDPAQNVLTYQGDEIVDPWNVRPAKWIFVSDYLIGRVPKTTSDLRLDPRNQFIESVRFSIPRGLELIGAKVTTIDQKLAAQGLGGIG